MRKLIGLGLLLVMFGLAVYSPSTAQEPAFAVITPENITQLEQLAVLERGRVQDVQWSPDGQWFAVMTSRAVWLYPQDALLDDPLPIGEHEAALTAFSFSPHSQSIVTGDTAGNVIFWDIATGEERNRYRELDRAIATIELSPNGQYVAAQYFKNDDYEDTVVHVWDMTSIGRIIEFTNEYDASDLIFVEDSQVLLADFKTSSDGFAESRIIAVDMRSAKTLADYSAFIGYEFAQNRDGSLVFLNQSPEWCCGEPDTIMLPFEPQMYLDGRVGAYQYAFSADEQFIYMIDSTQNLLKYPISNMTEGTQLEPEQFELPELSSRNYLWTVYLAVNPVTDMITVVDKLGTVYHFADMNSTPLLHRHFGYSLATALLADETLIVLERENIDSPTGIDWSNFYFMDLQGNRLATPQFDVIDGYVQQVEYSAERNLLAIMVFNHLDNHNRRYNDIFLIDIATQRIVRVNDEPTKFQSIVLDPTGTQLAILGGESFEDGYIAFQLFDIADDLTVSNGHTLYCDNLKQALTIPPRTLAFTTNPDYAVVSISSAYRVEVCHLIEDAPDLDQIPRLEPSEMDGSFEEIALSPDGQMVVAGGARYLMGGDGSTDLWVNSVGNDADWFAQVGQFTRIAAHTRPIRGITFSPDGQLFASVGLDGQVLFFASDTYELVHTIEVYGGAADINFSADGQNVIIAGVDGIVHIWGVSN